MLIAVGLFDARALGGFLLYVLGHGLLKGGLFACAGIVLHRLQYIGEPKLHGRGRGMFWTPVLFIVGAIGLAAAPGFLLEAAEAATSDAAKGFHFAWIRWIFFFGGIATAAAVLRFTFRTFFGWGAPAPSDRASRVDERQETDEGGRRVPATLFLPAACMIALALVLTFVPHIRETADAAARFFTDQSAYKSIVIDGTVVNIPPLEPSPPETSSETRGAIAGGIAIALALVTIFWKKIPLGGILDYAERGIPLLREWQSGHPGDYVSWIALGTAALGGSFVLLLR
jgi:multicomponent Na+:H+ antiporter subunit D